MPGRGIWVYYGCKAPSCKGKVFRNRQGVQCFCPFCGGSETGEIPANVDVRKLLEKEIGK